MCTDCNALYTRHNDLVDHRRVKHENILFPCRIELPGGLEIGCDQVFTRKVSRKRHLESGRGILCRTFHAVRPVRNVGISSSQNSTWSVPCPDTLGGDQNLNSSSTFDICGVAERIIGVAFWPLFSGSHRIVKNNDTRIRLFEDIHTHLLRLGVLLSNKHISASRQQPQATREEFICTFGSVGLLALYSSWIGQANETQTHLSVLGKMPFVEDLDAYAFKNNGYDNVVLSRNAIATRGGRQLGLPDVWEHYTSEATKDLVTPHSVSVGVRNPSSLARMLGTRYSRDSGWLAVTMEMESSTKTLSARISERTRPTADLQTGKGLDSVPHWQVLPTPTLWIQHSEGRSRGYQGRRSSKQSMASPNSEVRPNSSNPENNAPERSKKRSHSPDDERPGKKRSYGIIFELFMPSHR